MRRLTARRRRGDRLTLEAYLMMVAAAGIAALVAAVASHGAGLIGGLSPEVGVFTIFILLGELLTIKVPRHGDRISSSMSFVFAVMLISGAPVAMVAQAIASLIADFRERRTWMASSFNVGQQTLAVGAGGLVVGLLTDLPSASGSAPFSAADLPAILAAAGVFFLTNNVLAGTASALSLNTSVLGLLRTDFGFQALMAAVFLSLAPVIVVAAEFNLALIVMLILPLVTIYRGARDAMVSEHQAMHDALTGLPNRVLFSDRLNQQILSGQSDGSSLGVMMMDLNHFKEINDWLGHHYGDLLLQEIGPRLRGALRGSDTVARLGGDEFVILLPRVPGHDSACRVAEKLLQVLQRPFEIKGLALQVGASIGIAFSPADGDDVETLLQRADVAMFLAKESGRGYELYSAERDYSSDRLALAGEMGSAIDAGEIGFYYQPITDLRTGRVVSAEGLARWIHPEHGLLSPAQFIPIAEQSGLIRPLAMTLLKAALQEQRRWRDMGLELDLAVNVSPRQLLDQHFPDDLAALLSEHNASASALTLEITESSMMADPMRSEGVLGRLHSMGVKIAIDDFGTGYSSLAHLRHLPVDAVKIDRSFVMNMSSSASDARIVRSTIDLGRNLGLAIVAEGVETEDTCDELLTLGCDRAQGYFLSRPVPPEEFVQWLQKHRSQDSRGQIRSLRLATGA
jgi:diguanylate cyclase (GGDEF)-like protein